MLNFHYTDESGISLPVGYEIITKSEKVYDDKIVTEITPYSKFYIAGDYHQNYYNNNKNQGYCRAVITPKLDKFVKKYSAKLK